MQDFPHHYRVTADASTDSDVNLNGSGLPAIVSAPPAEFGGPGDKWSPESLLVAAVADCFVLSFRAIARASRLDWQSLNCSVNGILDKVERQTRFTAFEVSAELLIPEGTDPAKAERMLQKAEAVCLITNSLIADSHLEAKVSIAG
jgi:organic hydroperoxide reductase OsmC/OhrA